jgi:hypothetical protein
MFMQKLIAIRADSAEGAAAKAAKTHGTRSLRGD